MRRVNAVLAHPLYRKCYARLEELEIQPRPVSFSLLSDRMFADLSLLAEKEHLQISATVWKEFTCK